jgi:hypothetical protein
MLEQLESILPGLTNPTWVIPGVGVVIALVAFLVGRSFLSSRRAATQAEVLTAASKEALQGVVSDRRSCHRRTGNAVEVALWDGSEEPHRHAFVQDRSVGGLRLLMDEPVDEGAVFKVRPRFAQVSTPWTTIIVKSCRPDQGQWEVRCQFEQTPTYNVLLLFG